MAFRDKNPPPPVDLLTARDPEPLFWPQSTHLQNITCSRKEDPVLHSSF